MRHRRETISFEGKWLISRDGFRRMDREEESMSVKEASMRRRG
jgi:hypothetical protein